MRPLSYPQTDVFLVCFSVIQPSSLLNVRSKWYPELKVHAPDVPFIMVGTKMDMREDPETVAKLRQKRQSVITTAEGKKLAVELNAYMYIECSALTQEGLKQVFDEAIRCHISAKIQPKKIQGTCHARCVIL